MKTDLIITTRNRIESLRTTLESLHGTTPKQQYRLTVLVDGTVDDTVGFLQKNPDIVDHIVVSQQNEGLGPAFNKLIPFVGGLKGCDEKYSPLVCYVQDDVVFEDGWLEKLSSKFLQLERPLNLAFASGHGAVEHYDDPRARRQDLGQGMYTSKYIRATCMLARFETFSFMLPIPRIDPETGQLRGKPDNGRGSGVDWHFLRVHERSVVNTGMTNLVMPGLVKHAGYNKSTWLKRELPESEADRKVIG